MLFILEYFQGDFVRLKHWWTCYISVEKTHLIF